MLFFELGPRDATRMFLARAHGAFGLAVHSAHEPGGVVLASVRQPMGVAFGRDLALCLYGSERASLHIADPLGRAGLMGDRLMLRTGDCIAIACRGPRARARAAAAAPRGDASAFGGGAFEVRRATLEGVAGGGGAPYAELAASDLTRILDNGATMSSVRRAAIFLFVCWWRWCCASRRACLRRLHHRTGTSWCRAPLRRSRCRARASAAMSSRPICRNFPECSRRVASRCVFFDPDH